MRAPRLIVRDTIIDPARAKELINSEFAPDGAFLITSNERGSVGYRYDALPALAAAEPTAFGCIVCEDEGHSGGTALIAMLWDGVVTRLHKLSPVEAGAETVAEAGVVANDPGRGPVASPGGGVVVCSSCDLRAEAPQVWTCTRTDCPMARPWKALAA